MVAACVHASAGTLGYCGYYGSTVGVLWGTVVGTTGTVGYCVGVLWGTVDTVGYCGRHRYCGGCVLSGSTWWFSSTLWSLYVIASALIVRTCHTRRPSASHTPITACVRVHVRSRACAGLKRVVSSGVVDVVAERRHQHRKYLRANRPPA